MTYLPWIPCEEHLMASGRSLELRAIQPHPVQITDPNDLPAKFLRVKHRGRRHQKRLPLHNDPRPRLFR